MVNRLLTPDVDKAFLGNKVLYIYIFLRCYLFIHEKHRERGRDTGRGRSRLHAGSPIWGLILGLQDHALGPRQVLNH